MPGLVQAQNAASVVSPNSANAVQECLLAAQKIEKIRPNWLATSYGDCRSLSQCNVKSCQEEIARKYEYVETQAKQKSEQEQAQKKASQVAKTEAAGPQSPTDSAAIQECTLSFQKINQIRPNWLATSYGDCRSLSQCNVKSCQEEIARKYEYVETQAKQKSDQVSAKSTALALRAMAKNDPISQALNYIGGFDVAFSARFFYPLDRVNAATACKIGFYEAIGGSSESSRWDLEKLNASTLKISTSFERDSKGFQSVFTSTISGLEVPLICKTCTQSRLEKSWQSIFSACKGLKTAQ